MRLIKLCIMLSIIGSFLYADIPAGKQTRAGLYVTAQECYARILQNPDIKLLDVRTPEEYLFVGHAAMAVNIPLRFFAGIDSTAKPQMRENPQFIDQVKLKFNATDSIMVMCRAGGRSAAAINMLFDVGYQYVYQIVDGFEGDAVEVQNSYLIGKRILNGWKNSGAPWTYDLDADLVFIQTAF